MGSMQIRTARQVTPEQNERIEKHVSHTNSYDSSVFMNFHLLMTFYGSPSFLWPDPPTDLIAHLRPHQLTHAGIAQTYTSLEREEHTSGELETLLAA